MKIKIAVVLLLISGSLLSFINEPVLYYLVKQPSVKSAKPPLLILLHGVGSNEKDLFSFAEQLPGKFLVISARAPHKLGNESYGWYKIDRSSGKMIYDKREAEESRKIILKFIEELKSKHNFDEKQVYLCGFSQGAIMSYSVALTCPEKIKGIVIMSGKLLEEIKPLTLNNNSLINLKVFISHGQKDPVIDVKEAREANSFLYSLKIKATYKEYNDVHTINNEMFRDLNNWLTVN